MDWGIAGGSLSTLPNFIAYLATSVVLVAAFLAVYTAMTPHREWALIRGGNVAASLSLGGALIGFCLPLASVVAHSSLLIDVAIWGLIALFVQLAAWWVVERTVGGLAARVERGEVAAGIFLAMASLAAGIVNAACMTY
jgi:putative membrane protein